MAPKGERERERERARRKSERGRSSFYRRPRSEREEITDRQLLRASLSRPSSERERERVELFTRQLNGLCGGLTVTNQCKIYGAIPTGRHRTNPTFPRKVTRASLYFRPIKLHVAIAAVLDVLDLLLLRRDAVD